MSQGPESTVERLNALERRSSHLRVAIALIGISLFLTEVLPRQTVEARNYVLRDSAGAKRGMWRVRDSAPAFILQDETGHWRAVLDLGADGPSLRMYPPHGTAGFELAVNPDAARLQLFSGPDKDQSLTLSAAGAGAYLDLKGLSGRVTLPRRGRGRSEGGPR